MTKQAMQLEAVEVMTRRVLIPLFMKHAADLGLFFHGPEHLQVALQMCGSIEARRHAAGLAKTAQAIPGRQDALTRRLVTELSCNPDIMDAAEILST